jgi:hypothetical protein
MHGQKVKEELAHCQSLFAPLPVTAAAATATTTTTTITTFFCGSPIAIHPLSAVPYSKDTKFLPVFAFIFSQGRGSGR